METHNSVHGKYFLLDNVPPPFYMPVKDGTYYGITRGGRAGGRRPVLCPEHISKTTLARVMKFHGWIDLIQGKCSVQES